MAEAFLERFFVQVAEHLGDPRGSRRLTRDQMLRDLVSTEAIIWEDILRAIGQEATDGKAEATITLVADQRFYSLPGSFRQFLSFRKLNNGDPDDILENLPSIPFSAPGPGVEVLSEQRGIEIRPMPDSATAGDWTLTYIKGPITLHYATAADVGSQSIKLGTPAEGCGERIDTDDYYNASLIRVVSADIGAGQMREVADYNAETQACILKLPWSPKPTGTVVYEFRPAMPPMHDGVYALGVAMTQAINRAQGFRIGQLKKQYREAEQAGIRYFTSNVADRAPARLFPKREALDPYVA